MDKVKENREQKNDREKGEKLKDMEKNDVSNIENHMRQLLVFFTFNRKKRQ